MPRNLLALLTLLIFLPGFSYSQQKFIHPSIVEIRFSLSDFKNDNVFGNINNMHGGLGFGFTKGMSNHLDWQLNLNGCYTDSVTDKLSLSAEKNMLLQADFSLRARMFGEHKVVQPYLGAGLGFSLYRSKFGVYVPAGVGLQFSIFKEAYVLVNSQYRFGLTNINNHFYYSIGVAGTVGKRKPGVAAPKKEVTPPIVIVAARDRDSDGIVDTVDLCPDEAGLAIFNGCPDTDNDGIPNKNDNCPTVPGIAKYQGCPIPDRDKDGVNDEEDKCIDVPGVKENAGCPIIRKEIRELVDSAAKHIFFRTGSAELLPASYASLDKVVKVLKENPDVKISIEGHTDNVGKPDANQQLSERRAQSVLQYFKTNGITENRLSAKGFGLDQPIADNNTAEGRAMNRRVELKLSY
jgi:OOP family OmpA-OmpF porin